MRKIDSKKMHLERTHYFRNQSFVVRIREYSHLDLNDYVCDVTLYLKCCKEIDYPYKRERYIAKERAYFYVSLLMSESYKHF